MHKHSPPLDMLLLRVPVVKHFFIFLPWLFALLSATLPARGGELTIAAASDLRFAMDEILENYRDEHPDENITVIYGSSGKFRTQIENGAPFDLYFSADIAYPKQLAEKGLAASEVKPYARGRIVLWSRKHDASDLELADLVRSDFRKIAIANPKHAPYGKRAEEALKSSGLWEQLQPRLVFGENIAQTAHLVETGAADVGIIALSLALNPELKKHGGHSLIPEELHRPLEQGFIVTARARDNPLAQDFAQYMESETARAVLRKYGFVLPEEKKADPHD